MSLKVRYGKDINSLTQHLNFEFDVKNSFKTKF